MEKFCLRKESAHGLAAAILLYRASQVNMSYRFWTHTLRLDQKKLEYYVTNVCFKKTVTLL